MHEWTRHVMCAGLALVLLAGSANGQEDQTSSSDLEERLRAIQSELDRQRAANEDMRAEIDDLRARTDDDWLTEERAEQVREIVYETLADADTRSSLQDSGMTAGWNEHFFLASPDGRFKLQLEGQMQVRYMYNYRRKDPDRQRSGFENTRTKLTLRGHVFGPDIQYLVRTDVTRDEPGLVTGLDFLQDAWVRFRLSDRWALRVGQFKLPFNREELVSSAGQLAVERSLINENHNLGRTQGIELLFTGRTNRLSMVFSDGASDNLARVSNTPLAGAAKSAINTNALVEGTQYAFTARYEELIAGTWDQFADMTSPIGEEFAVLVGVAGHVQMTEHGTPDDEKQWYTATADLSIEFGGANLFAAATYHYVDSIFGGVGQIHTTGFVAQGGVYLGPKLETFARFEYGLWDWELPAISDLTLVTVGFNYYIDGHDLKWSTDVGYGISQVEAIWGLDERRSLTGWRNENNGRDGQVVVRTQLQLLF
jgi:hypothetical protein